MIRKNTILYGVLWGLVIPFVGVAILMMIDENITAMEWEIRDGYTYRGQPKRTLFLLGICLNLIPLRIFQNRGWFQSIRGLIFPTLAYAFAWMIYFGSLLVG